MKSRAARCLASATALSVLLSLLIGNFVAAQPSHPLYPPGPPYSRSGNGGASPNTWNASGQGNPQFGRSGSTYWWQCPPQIFESA
jgi:hypothetical protein